MGVAEDGHGFEGALSHDQLLTDPMKHTIRRSYWRGRFSSGDRTSHGAYKIHSQTTGEILAISRIAEIHANYPTPTW